MQSMELIPYFRTYVSVDFFKVMNPPEKNCGSIPETLCITAVKKEKSPQWWTICGEIKKNSIQQTKKIYLLNI